MKNTDHTLAENKTKMPEQIYLFIYVEYAVKYSDRKMAYVSQNSHHELKSNVHLANWMSGYMCQIQRFCKYLCFVIFWGKDDSLQCFTAACKRRHYAIEHYS